MTVNPGETLLSQLVAQGSLRQKEDVAWSIEQLQRRGVVPTADAVLALLVESGRLPAKALSYSQEMTTQAPPEQVGGVPGLPAELIQRFTNWCFLGQGGMGVVYYAFDPVLERPVAIKLLRRTKAKAESLLREARHQARQEHPNICPVFEVGEADGISYVVMHYIKGESLLELQAKLPRQQLLALFARLARAVHAAHQGGLVHGDLKPANMLVESAPDGLHPWLVDFGMATALANAGPARGGTPAYMAPELVLGSPPSPAADVFSLGASLYHLLTGSPPEEGASLAILARRTQPSWSPPGLPAHVGNEELAAIVRKAMAREPRDRYPSAQAFADDLENYLAGDPVAAVAGSWVYRARKWYNRHKVRAWLSFALTVTLVGSLSGAVWLRYRAQQQAALRADLLARVAALEERVRNVWTAPSHDVRPELEALEGELAESAASARQRGLNEVALHYLLGRAYLALEQPVQAEEELARAWKPKSTVPEIAFVYAQALLSRYFEEARQLDRIPRREWREKKAAELKEKYLRKADEVLQHVRGPAPSGGILARSLLAAAREDWVRSAEFAQQAFEANRSNINALHLAGEAELRLALAAWEAGEWASAAEHEQRAADAFETVLRLAPSYPLAALGLAKAWLTAGAVAKGQGQDPRLYYRQSLDYCDLALRLDSQMGEAHVSAAFTLLGLGDYIVRRGQTMPKDILEAISHHVLALEGQPQWAGEMESYLGTALHLASWHEPPEAARALRREARVHLENGLRASPRLPMALNNLSLLAFQDGLEELNEGVDPTPTLSLAETQGRALLQEFPDYLAAPSNLAAIYWAFAQWDLWHGRDPGHWLTQGRELLEHQLSRNPRYAQARNNLATLLLTEAVWLQWQGQSAAAALARAWAMISEADVAEADRNAYITRLQLAVARVREAVLQDDRTADAESQLNLQLAETLRERPGEWDVLAAAAEARLLLARLDDPARATQLLVKGFEDLQSSADIVPRHAEVCRLQVAFALALPASAPAKKRAQDRASVCLEHWRNSKIFQFLSHLSRGGESPRDPEGWPGLKKEVALWRTSGPLPAAKAQ